MKLNRKFFVAPLVVLAIGTLSIGSLSFSGCAPKTDVAENVTPDAETKTDPVTSKEDSSTEPESNTVENTEKPEANPEKTELVEPSLNAPDHAGSDKPSESATGDVDGTLIEVAEEGGVKFTATKDWEVVKPRSRIVEYELAIPNVDGQAEDLPNGRLTIMGAMGSVEANIQRWHGQFKQPDGSSTADATKQETMDVNGNEVTIVDIGGTYIDSPGGPFAGGKKIERPDYRMLAAIVQAGTYGQYFVKFYGSEKTVTANEKAFRAMINSLQVGE